MLQVINERLNGTSLHNFRPQKTHGPIRMFRSSGKLDDLYSSVATGDGEKAYLGDGVWITPDGKLTDEGR